MKLSVLAVLICVAIGCAGQAPQPQSAAVPTQVQQVMGYFVGDWTLKGTSKLSPNSPAVPFTGKDKSAWVPGEFFVESHTEVHSSLGDVRSTRVMEYSPQKQAYTYNLYNSLGEHIEAVGHQNGNTWTWEAVQKLSGVATSARYTFSFVSVDTYTFKSEVLGPDGKWATVMDGTATRVAAPQQ